MSNREREQPGQAKCSTLSIPQVLYQNVKLEISLEEERILGQTTLWLGFDEALSDQTTFSLHCRVDVKNVTVNGLPAMWDLRDPLNCLDYDDQRRHSYLAEDLDCTYRAALEMAREGEMRITLPASTPSSSSSKTKAASQEQKGNELEETGETDGGLDKIDEGIIYTLPPLQSAPPLPLGAPADVRAAYDCLEEQLWASRNPTPTGPSNNNTSSSSESKVEYNDDDDDDDDAALGENLMQTEIPLEEQGQGGINNEREGRACEAVYFSGLVQVCITYEVDHRQGKALTAKSPRSSNNSGVAFRRSADDDAALERVRAARRSGELGLGMDYEEGDVLANYVAPPPSCVYTVGAGGVGGLCDADGVRCWVPCIDSPDQRALFDITLHAPSECSVVASGRRVSEEDSDCCFASNSNERTTDGDQMVLDLSAGGGLGQESTAAVEYTATRFVCAGAIPAYSVGFFCGAAETYKMPLYRVHGRVWVATCLTDTAVVAEEDNASQKYSDISWRGQSMDLHVAAMEQPGFKRLRSDSLSGQPSLGRHGSDGGIGTPVLARQGSDNSSLWSRNSAEEYDEPAYLYGTPGSEHRRPRSASLTGGLAGNSNSKRERSNSLNAGNEGFAMPVGHPARRGSKRQADGRSGGRSSLYEAQVRHTSLGLDMSLRLLHKFSGHLYPNHNYTQVYVPGLEHTLSFDGMSLISATHLHGLGQVAAETPSHLKQLQAYLYSWLMVALPVDSWDLEWALHGLVGYLQHVHIDQIFGEAEAAYRLQKQIDTVLSLDKMQAGCNLAQGYLRSVDRVSARGRTYVRCKSTVLFCLLECRMGGRDCMRLAIQALVQSPSLFKQKAAEAEAGAKTPNGNGDGGTPMSVDKSDKADAQSSFNPLVRSIISLQDLFSMLQGCSAHPLNTPETFSRLYLQHSGAVLLHVSSGMENFLEGSAGVRTFYLTVIPLPARGMQERAKIFPQDCTVRIVEARDDAVTDQMFSLRGKMETVQHQVPARSTRKSNKKAEKKDERPKPAKELTQEQQDALARADLKKREAKDALDDARALEYPIRMVQLDPLHVGLVELGLHLPESCLVEQLFSQADGKDFHRHAQALRALSLNRSHAPPAMRDGYVGDPVPDEQLRRSLALRAFSSCILNTVRARGFEPRVVSSFPVVSSVEAAFALTQWQNERAPISVPLGDGGEPSLLVPLNNLFFEQHGAAAGQFLQGKARTAHDWVGLATLLYVLRKTCMHDSEQGKVMPTSANSGGAFGSLERSAGPSTADIRNRFTPVAQDLWNENQLLLRQALLLALAKVRARDGSSPLDVSDTLLSFAWHFYTDEERCAVSGKDNDADTLENHDQVLENGRKKDEKEKGSDSEKAVQDRNKKAKGAAAKAGGSDSTLYHSTLLHALSLVHAPIFSENARSIADFAVASLEKDWAAVRTDARIKEAQALEALAQGAEDTRVALPFFESEGVVTAASLTCLAQLDIAQHSLVNRLRQGQGKSRESISRAQLPPPAVVPDPVSVSALNSSSPKLVNYLSYFLPPGCVLGRDMTSDMTTEVLNTLDSSLDSVPLSLELEVPGNLARAEGRFYAACTSVIRSTALECFVRLCFVQHHTYRKRYKAWASEGPNLGQRGGRSQTFTVPPAETGFVPLALQACLAVLAQDSSRETRRQAALTLNNALRGLPPRLTARAISRGEPLRCIAWDDEEALSAAPLKAKMRNNRLAVRVARGALAKRVIEDWWSLLVDGCGDEEVRAELVGAWNFVFAQALEEGASSVPAVLRAHVSKGCDMDVDARSDELGTASNQSALAAKLHLPEDCVAAHETDLHAIFFAASRHLQGDCYQEPETTAVAEDVDVDEEIDIVKPRSGSLSNSPVKVVAVDSTGNPATQFLKSSSVSSVAPCAPATVSAMGISPTSSMTSPVPVPFASPSMGSSLTVSSVAPARDKRDSAVDLGAPILSSHNSAGTNFTISSLGSAPSIILAKPTPGNDQRLNQSSINVYDSQGAVAAGSVSAAASMMQPPSVKMESSGKEGRQTLRLSLGGAGKKGLTRKISLTLKKDS